MVQKIWEFTEEAKELNDALNRLSMVASFISNEREDLARDMRRDLAILQKFVNENAYCEFVRLDDMKNEEEKNNEKKIIKRTSPWGHYEIIKPYIHPSIQRRKEKEEEQGKGTEEEE